MTQQTIGILGTGSYVPERHVTNGEVAARVDVPEEWIEKKTQIAGRRYAADHEATSDLAVHAATGALERAGLTADRIDYLIVSTSTPDSPQPPTAYHVQRALGADSAACLDINVVCSGFVYGLALANSLVAHRPGSHALVVAADVYSRILDFSDRRTAVLLGDGAGAAVVGAAPEGLGFLDFELGSRGDKHNLIRVEAGGSRVPTSPETIAAGGHFFRMEGRDVRDFVMENFPPVADKICARNGVALSDVQHFVPHQPNGVLLTEMVNRAGLAGAHTHRTLERYGNVGSASAALTLDEANRAGHLKEGELVLIGTFGGGMSIGAGLMRWVGAA
ncbi:3-oxoacyl-ACP synthase III family protein [Streptomyces litchfieldiae]|uniref:Ketoacyl-ACP synthase III n=1 Tax=Streptomyces litchfieldiae TaxID=3075543 RepID=A0ABU2MNK6_9ACTN|nr:ketoacyl-ACP synthase III [Streptomyces sp. DSM 44938]MDT0343202.1 ketoacyl-ACP synthase III [Streptomyces sp. DSM 44938]